MTWTLLHDACENNRIDEICRLAGDNPGDVLHAADDHGSTPLHLLCMQGNPDIRAVESLLDACPQALSDKDFHGNTPLHAACSSPNVDRHLVKVLLDAYPDAATTANREGLLPLHMACRYAPNSEGVIGILIEANPQALQSHIKMGSPVPGRKKDSLGKKNDHHALFEPNALTPCTDAVGLRYQGASEQVRDGSYPLHMAVSSRAPVGVLELLIKYEPDILFKTNKFGETPLHLALKDFHPDGNDSDDSNDAGKLLFLRVASRSVRSPDINGNLPLHIAAMSGCSVRVAKKLLLIWPEAIHEMNHDGRTPMDVARQHHNCSKSVVRLLSIAANENLAD